MSWYKAHSSLTMKKLLKIKLLYFITLLLIIIFKFTALHAKVPDPVFKQKAASPTHTDISGIEFNNDGTKPTTNIFVPSLLNANPYGYVS